MITDRNFKEVILQIPENNKQRIIDSDKEYCVLFLHIFNVGSFTECKLTNNYERYKNVRNNGNTIRELSEVSTIIEEDNETNKISNNIAENIAKKFEHLDGKEHRKAVFKHYRNNDESPLYPIHNSFNVTERAIQRLRRFEREGGFYLLGLELCLSLDDLISEIVNN